jgi:hypothetical protein
MKVQGAYGSRERVYSDYTRVVRVEEETQQTPESASGGKEAEEK